MSLKKSITLLSLMVQGFIKSFPFHNNSTGFDKLVNCLSSWKKSDLVIGLESTAHYGNNLINFLLSNHFNVALINPLQTSSLRKANIRNTKNDKVDTLVIAKSLLINNYRLLSEEEFSSVELKSLCSTKRELTLLSSRCKIKLHALLDQVFPELEHFFRSGIHIAASYALLLNFPSPKAISSARSSSLLKVINQASRGRFSISDILELKKIAKNSVGIDNVTLSFQIQLTIQQILFF